MGSTLPIGNIPNAFWQSVPWPYVLAFLTFVVFCSSPTIFSWINGRAKIKDAARKDVMDREKILNSYSDSLYVAAIKRAETAEARCNDLAHEIDCWKDDSYRGWGKARYWELITRSLTEDIKGYQWSIDNAKILHPPFKVLNLPPMEEAPFITPEQYAQTAHDKTIKSMKDDKP